MRVVTLVYQFYVAVKRIRWGLLFYLLSPRKEVLMNKKLFRYHTL
nr:MAG TPA: hypothetical protein [Caudoviricetes sp.]